MSVPVVVAALAQRIPVVLLEQNAVPGRATRMLARRARVVAASFAETAGHLPHARVVHTGNPVRAEVRGISIRPIGDRLRSILVTGGSQGARRLNRAVAGCMVELLSGDPVLRIVHQCGSLDYEAVERAAESLPPHLAARYTAAAFFDDMAVRMAESDLVVMRAGGSSIAECAVLGRPMIVVPYPHAGGHQRHNAAPYVAAGAAMLIDDAECTPERLEAEIRGIGGRPGPVARHGGGERGARPARCNRLGGPPHRRSCRSGPAEQRRVTRHVHVLGICGYATFGAAKPRAGARRPGHRLRRPRVPADERRGHCGGHRVGEPQRPGQPRPVGNPGSRGGRQPDATGQPRARSRAPSAASRASARSSST